MQVQAAVIHVDTAHGCQRIVADEAFCMEKSWLILVDAHAAFNQWFII